MILIFGIHLAFAELLNFYGKIEQIVEIQSPTFYASVTNLGGSYYSLHIGHLSDGAKGKLTFGDGDTLYFVSRSLNIKSWNPLLWEVFINIGTNRVDNKINVALEIIHEDFSSKFHICSQQITLDSTSNKTYKIECPGGEIGNLSTDDMLQLKIWGVGPTSQYTLYVDQSTRIQILYM